MMNHIFMLNSHKNLFKYDLPIFLTWVGWMKSNCSRHILFLEENIINPCSAWDQVPSCYFSLSNLFLHQNNEFGVGFQTTCTAKTLKRPYIQVHARELFETSWCCCSSYLWQWHRPDYLLLLLFFCNNNIMLTWLEPLASITKVGGVMSIIAGGKDR